MFNKKNYILTLTDRGELRLKNNRNKNTIEKIEIDSNVFSNNKINDEIQFAYILNKILVEVDVDSNLIIRYASKDNIFRIHKIDNLKSEEIDGYMNYNIDDILPFSKENLIIKYLQRRDEIYIFAMNKDVVNFLKDNLLELGYENIYLTTYASELVSYVYEKNIGEAIFLNIEKYSIEKFIIKNYQILNYRQKAINQNIDYKLLEIGNSQHEIIKIEFFSIIDEIQEHIENFESIPIFISGDWEIASVWKKMFLDEYKKDIESLYFDISKYFGVD